MKIELQISGNKIAMKPKSLQHMLNNYPELVTVMIAEYGMVIVESITGKDNLKVGLGIDPVKDELYIPDVDVYELLNKFPKFITAFDSYRILKVESEKFGKKSKEKKNPTTTPETVPAAMSNLKKLIKTVIQSKPDIDVLWFSDSIMDIIEKELAEKSKDTEYSKDESEQV